MTLLESIILAIVEGLTEFLPISSTGHMILMQGVLGIENSPFVRAFTVMIQFGAILSVVILYYRRFFVLREDPKWALRSPRGLVWIGRWGFYLRLIVALIPAVIFGVLLEEQIDALLGNVYIVAVMLLLGGVFMLWIDQLFGKKKTHEEVSYKDAWWIGCFQTLAMIPGISRSMATIVGGLQQGLSRRAATEFSFFLAVPTMLGATLLKVYKLWCDPTSFELLKNNWMQLFIGNLIALAIALVAIRFFLHYVTRYGFRVFGIYRIIVGTLFLVLLLCGAPLTIQ